MDTNNDHVVLDSGERTQYPTGAVRDRRRGKGRFDLIPPLCERRLALVYEGGAAKYGDSNWQRGIPLTEYIDSAKRHIADFVQGNNPAEDHLMHAVFNLYGAAWTLDAIRRGVLPQSLDNLHEDHCERLHYRMRESASASGEPATRKADIRGPAVQHQLPLQSGDAGRQPEPAGLRDVYTGMDVGSGGRYGRRRGLMRGD